MHLRIYCLLFIFTLFLPMLQHTFSIPPSTPLMGKEEVPPEVKWSLAGWLNGSCQEQYGKRRASRLGLRGHLVKTHNQLHYSLFHRVVSTTSTNVIIGKDNWLYEKGYVDKLNTASKDDGAFIEGRVQQLRILQDKLKDLGIAFVFVIAPSKAELYPEFIPANLLKKPLPEGTTSDYQQARVALERQGINYVDTHTIFAREKQEKEYQLFGPSGVHWNKYGAYLAWANLAPLVNDHIRVPLQIPALKRVESRTSELIEADLASLLNFWETALTSPLTDYPVFVDTPIAKTDKPSVLIVGDSFMFTLVDTVAKARLTTDLDVWYYFKRHFKYPAQGDHINLDAPIETSLTKGPIDWQNQLFKKDLVILVATEIWLPELGFGFIEEALAAIERTSDRQTP